VGRSHRAKRAPAKLAARIEAVEWERVSDALDAEGCAHVRGLLTRGECATLTALYARDELFRKTITMARHGFGRGEYRYFADPLPQLVAELRARLYPHLVPTANRWSAVLGDETRYPSDHARYRARCHAAGQRQPTPLLLRYGPDDFNCLHQDLYGELVFPLQVAVLLSEPGREFTGGELVLTEQRPRMQSRAMVLVPRQGDAVVFAVRERPVQGTRGPYRVQLRHGVSKVRSGERFTLGVIFHDAAAPSAHAGDE
jgi:hypothetical protein